MVQNHHNHFLGSFGSSRLRPWSLWQSSLHHRSHIVKDRYEGENYLLIINYFLINYLLFSHRQRLI